MSPRSLLVAAALLAAPAFAPAVQAQTTFGLKAGLNVSDLTGDGAPPNTDPRLGFAGGAFANVPIGYSGAYVQPEVLYAMKGVTNANTTLAIDYIEVPVVLGYATPVTDSGLMVGGYAGPSLGFKVRESLGNSFGNLSNDVFKSFDLGAAVGVTVGAGPFGIDGRYTFGVTDILDANTNSSVRNGAFTIAGTYRFGAGSTARRPGRRY